MHQGLKLFRACLLAFFALPASLAAAQERMAVQDRMVVKAKATTPKAPRQRAGTQRYIVVLEDPSLVQELVRLEQADKKARGAVQGAESARLRGPRGKLKFDTGVARERLDDIDARFESFRTRLASRLGRTVEPVHRYRLALNGFAVRLSAAEAKELAKMDGVRSVQPDVTFALETFAGPPWIGAERVWSGASGAPANRGEGVIIGVIDSGANWEHPSFADPGENGGPGHDHVNPYPSTLGLCGQPLVGAEGTVDCNDKLVGVYDFVEDDPDTEVVEEYNNGADNGQHGAHTASTAAGNPIQASFSSGAPLTLSGVAPNATLVSYRVCYVDELDDNAGRCRNSDFLAGIDQAVADGVDVINYSLGGEGFDPWGMQSSLAFLDAFEAGVFVATSAGNEGPVAGSINSPAFAPWVTAVGSATHDTTFASLIENLSGGGSTPPDDLIGQSFTEGLADRPIVYAGDYGNALCGVGEAELQPDCDDNTGSTNPFEPGTFNGEIVVCDRGTYGRVEKGKNVELAGAGGYILADTDTSPQGVVADNHCLPASHIDRQQGNVLRSWLANGTGHRGSISGFILFTDPALADRVSGFSSRGPNQSPAQDVLKPNLIAPGNLIFAAGGEGSEIVGLSGTSMASPHVAGAAALLIADNPNLTPAQVASMLELTATDELAKDTDLGEATPFDIGAGRVRVDEAIQSGLYLDETGQAFRDADPFNRGDPRTLNLASMTDAACQVSCSFARRVGAFESGNTWTASTSGFPAGVTVTVTPASFTPVPGVEQDITVDIDWSGAPVSGEWFFGKVLLDSPGQPTAAFPVSIYATLGELPGEWLITTDRNAGFRDYVLTGLGELPRASYTAGGLVSPDRVSFELIEDPTWQDPFDGGEGVQTLLFDIPPGTLWFHTDTPPAAPEDVDLFVGFDSNRDGQAQESEVICESTSPDDVEFCDIFSPDPGSWWVLVQNWEADSSLPDDQPTPLQEITLVSAVVTAGDSDLVATGPGRVEALEAFDVRLSWDGLGAPAGSELLGAVAIGSSAGLTSDVGVVPVRLQRTGVAPAATTPLMDGRDVSLAIAGGTEHDRLFIDVPPGVQSLDVQVAGETAAQNNTLSLDLVRVDFDDAFDVAPMAGEPVGAPVASAAGAGGQGPSLSLEGGVTPGRWYAVVSNSAADPASVRVRATLGEPQIATPPATETIGGLWEPVRPGGTINQGFDFSPSGNNRAFIWYTYERDDSATWYLAAAPDDQGNSWTADLLRFTNDGSDQQSTKVGDVAFTWLADDDAILSWTLFGDSGSDRVTPLTRACPEVNGEPVSYTGLWYRGIDGLGGASVLADVNQAFIHYLYDGMGEPRWLLASSAFGVSSLDLFQYTGYCPTCSGDKPTAQPVGTMTINFADNTAGQWSLDYTFAAPSRGMSQRTEDIVKLTDTVSCSN